MLALRGIVTNYSQKLRCSHISSTSKIKARTPIRVLQETREFVIMKKLKKKEMIVYNILLNDTYY